MLFIQAIQLLPLAKHDLGSRVVGHAARLLLVTLPTESILMPEVHVGNRDYEDDPLERHCIGWLQAISVRYNLR